MRRMATSTFGLANHLALIACFISYEKRMQNEKCPNNIRLRYVKLVLKNLYFVIVRN